MGQRRDEHDGYGARTFGRTVAEVVESDEKRVDEMLESWRTVVKFISSLYLAGRTVR